MAASYNRVILIGRLGADPEIRTFANGGKVANMRVATSRAWKDKTSGERKEATEWHMVAVHADGAVGFAEKYLNKGDLVHVEGELRTRKWQDQSGADRYSTEVVVPAFGGSLGSLTSKADKEGHKRDGDAGGTYGDGNGGTRGKVADLDDEIPF